MLHFKYEGQANIKPLNSPIPLGWVGWWVGTAAKMSISVVVSYSKLKRLVS